MRLSHTKPDSDWAKSAFTLVEMLVVIAIISILMTVGSIGLSGMGGKGVSSGVATTESLMDEAGTIAVGRGIRTCVLVAKSLTDNHADDLRRILVASEEVDANGKPVTGPDQDPTWVLSSRGAVLPDQVFFSQEFSKKNHTTGTEALKDIQYDNKDVKAAFKGTYYIYEFNDQGICATPGASFVLGSGTRNLGKPATDQPPRVVGSAKRDFGGFVIWRNGRTSMFRSPEQIDVRIKSFKSGDKF